MTTGDISCGFHMRNIKNWFQKTYFTFSKCDYGYHSFSWEKIGQEKWEKSLISTDDRIFETVLCNKSNVFYNSAIQIL